MFHTFVAFPAFMVAVIGLIVLLAVSHLILAVSSAKVLTTGDVPPQDEMERGFVNTATKIAAIVLAAVVEFWCIGAFYLVTISATSQFPDVATAQIRQRSKRPQHKFRLPRPSPLRRPVVVRRLRPGQCRLLRFAHRSVSEGSVMEKAIIHNFMQEMRYKNGEMTQLDLAESVGIIRQTVIALEKGKYYPSLELAFRISGVFGLPLEEVFRFELQTKPRKQTKPKKKRGKRG